jgi:hypothetical protein
MAVVGEAHVIVRAITNRVRPDIQRAFEGLDGIGERYGRDISDSFSRGLSSGDRDRGGLFSAKFRKEAEDARLGLQRLITTGYFLGPAFTALAGTIGALAGGLLTLGATAAAVGAGGLVAIAGTLTAIGQAALTAKLAFSGVSKALSAGLKTQKASASNDKAIAAAKRRLADAQLKLKRLQTEGKPELLAQLAKRQLDAEESLADAKIASSRSERAYRDALESSNKATEQLNKTREEAKEKLQQLRFETEGAAISEKKARLEFIKARDALQRVQDLPPNSRARQEAELAFAEADLNLRKAIDRNKDLKKEEKAATAAGVEGSQAVKDAVLTQRNAREAAADAAIDYAKSIKSVKDAEKAAADAANEATDDPKKSKAVRDINRQIASSVRDVRDAEKDLADARKGPGTDAFNDALSELSPEAQKFVKYLLSLSGAFKKLKAAAGKELFPKLEEAIRKIVTEKNLEIFEGLLQDTGSALGDVAIDFANAITEAENFKSLQNVWKNNNTLIRRLGKGAAGLYGGFITLLDAAGPLIDKFGLWIQRLGETFEKTMKAKKATGELQEFFENISRISSGLGAAFKKGFGSLGDIIDNVIAPGGAADIFVKYLDTTFQKWKNFTEGGAENEKLTGFLNGLTTNFTKILDLLGNIVGESAKVGASPEFGIFIDKLNEAVDIFGSIGEEFAGTLPALGDVVVEFAKLVKVFADSGAIQIFFETLSKIFSVISKVFGSDIGQKILIFTGSIFAVYRAFALVGKGAKFVFMGIIGSILKVKNTFGSLLKFIRDPFGKFRAGSGLTRKELQKQMIVDKQKKAAMRGVYLSADQAAGSLRRVSASSTAARTGMQKSTAAAKVKTGVLRGLGAAARTAGRGLALIGGPIGILLLVLPLIIENWDKIVAFFKELPKKIGEIFSKVWGAVSEKVPEIWTKVSTWFTETLIPGIIDFGKKLLEILAFILFPIPSLIIKFWPEITKFFSETVFPWFKALPGKVLEFAGKIWNFLKDTAITAWNGLVTWFNIVWTFYRELPGKVLGFAGKVWNFLSDKIKDAWNAVTTYFTNTLVPWLTGLPKRFVDGAGKIWGFISGGLQTAYDAAKNKMSEVLDWVKGIPTRFTNNLKGIWSFLSNGLQGAWELAKNWWNTNVASKRLTIGGFEVFGKKLPSFTLGLPRLAMGGIVPPTRGGMLSLIGEGGKSERVEPLDPDGLSKRDKAMIDYMSGGAGRGITVNVYPSAGMDERELANLVSRQLAYQMRRGAA